MPPLVIWKQKSGSRAISTVSSVWVAHQPKAWVDSELLAGWIDRVFPPVLKTQGKALVWDSMRAHVSKKIKAKCSQRDIAMCVVPGGLTPYLQAGDIGIYKVFKDNLTDRIDAWKRSDDVSYTARGNPSGDGLWLRADGLARDIYLGGAELDRTAGFHDSPSQWLIWNHDIYGWQFQQQGGGSNEEAAEIHSISTN